MRFARILSRERARPEGRTEQYSCIAQRPDRGRKPLSGQKPTQIARYLGARMI
jgi:hypothetical protein